METLNPIYKNKVFLGGTCGGKYSWDWRKELIEKLPEGIDYYDPFLREWETNATWDDEAQKREIIQRERCEFTLYVITSDFKGIYSFCEAVADSCTKDNGKTVVAFIDYNRKIQRDAGMIKSIQAFLRLCNSHGAKICSSIDQIVEYLSIM